MDYEMTCYVNIEQALEKAGLVFTYYSPVSGGVGGQLTGTYSPGRDATLVRWRETTQDDVVEVTDLMTGEIYALLGNIEKAEKLAFQLACSYTNGGNK